MNTLKKIEGNKLDAIVSNLEIKNLKFTSYDREAIITHEFDLAPEKLIIENAPNWSDAYMQSEVVKTQYNPTSKGGTPTHINFDYTLIYLKLDGAKPSGKKE